MDGYERDPMAAEPPTGMAAEPRTGMAAEPPTGVMAATPVAEEAAAGRRAALSGLLMMLIGAWGGAVAYFGPEIGLSPAGARSWQWTTAHTILNLAPGAAAFAGGLMVMFGSRLLAGGLQRLGALLTFGAGGWFVLGAAVYPVFYGTPAPGYGHVAGGPLMNLAAVAGYGAGVGIALCLLSGVAMAWSMPRVMRSRRAMSGATRRHRGESGLPLRNTDPVGV
ncbi:MAG TPA: hypothetical protein VFH50_04495 [Acidimicrobiales bacterium]|nr:hypothetical protein [Acidimicrobiales bacterium]